MAIMAFMFSSTQMSSLRGHGHLAGNGNLLLTVSFVILQRGFI